MKISADRIDELIAVVFRLMTIMKNGKDECCKECGLSDKELTIVNYVGSHSDVKMTDISAFMKAPLSTLTSIANKMVDNGYLIRYHSDEDRRVINVSLGKEGKDTFNIFRSKKEVLAENILKNYDEAEQVKLIELLERMVNTIDS